MRKIKRPSGTRELRHKLCLSQTELGLLVGSQRAMISQHESGKKELNVTAAAKLSTLMFCVNGLFEATDAAPVSRPERITNLTLRKCERMKHQLSLKRTTLVDDLERMHRERQSNLSTLQRLMQLNLATCPGFTEADEAWRLLVIERLRLKIVSNNGERALQIKIKLQQTEAAIAVLTDQIARLVEPLHEDFVVGFSEHLTAQPAEEDHSLQIVPINSEHHARGLDLLPETVRVHRLGRLNEARDEVEESPRPIVRRMFEVFTELPLQAVDERERQLHVAQFVLDNERDHAPFEAPLLAHHRIDALIVEGDLPQRAVGSPVIGRIEIVHRQIEAHVDGIALINLQRRQLQRLRKQRNRSVVFTRVGVHRRFEHHRLRPQRMRHPRLFSDQSLQTFNPFEAALKPTHAVERMRVHVAKLRPFIGMGRSKRLVLFESAVHPAHVPFNLFIAFHRRVRAADDRRQRQLKVRMIGFFGRDFNARQHRIDDGFRLRRKSVGPHRLELVVDDRRRHLEFAKRRIGTGIGLPALAHLDRIDLQQVGIVDVDQVNIFEQRIAS